MNKYKHSKKLWNKVEKEKQDKDIAKKVYNWLNHDNLGSLITKNKVYWIEFTTKDTELPEDIFNYIDEFMNNEGYIYLFTKI